MHPLIHLTTNIFDLNTEPENPINPIRGASLLEWLRTKLPAGAIMSAAEPEDWGWYSCVQWYDGRKYLIGTCAHERVDGGAEWAVQVEKQRALKERLLGQGKLTMSDSCLSFLKQVIDQEPGFTNVSIELEP